MAADRVLYRYQIAAGAGLFGPSQGTCRGAKAAAERLAQTLPGMGPFEIERVQTLPNGARRYWRRWGNSWRLWHGNDPEPKARKAWCVP